MKAVRLFGMAVALTLVASSLQAQGTKPVSVGVMGGLSLPLGDFGDGYDSGYNITGNVYLTPAGRRFTLRGDLGYERFENSSNIALAGASISMLSVTGNVLFPLSASDAEGSMRPYLIGGGGLYRASSKFEVLGVSRSASSSDLGIAVGGGIEFKLAGFSTFAEARFTNVFSDGGSRWIPITFGVRF